MKIEPILPTKAELELDAFMSWVQRRLHPLYAPKPNLLLPPAPPGTFNPVPTHPGHYRGMEAFSLVMEEYDLWVPPSHGVYGPSELGKLLPAIGTYRIMRDFNERKR